MKLTTLQEIQPDERHWYVLRSKANKEFVVYDNIEQKKRQADSDIEVYLPKFLKGNRWHALFSGYVFVKHDFQGFHLLKCLPGVKEYVGFGGYPTPMKEKELHLMQQVELHFQNIKTVPVHLVTGAPVKIIKGPLTGYTGIITSVKNGQKVALTIDHLGQSLLVHIPKADLTILKS